MSIHHKKLFCFGYGYTCDYLGHELRARDGWHVSGTTRSESKREALDVRQIEAHIFNYERPLPDVESVLDGVTHLLLSAPPNEGGDPAFQMHGRELAKIPTLEWVGYLSTTGVYGDRGGEWVDETTTTAPSSQRGSRRRKAEDQWLSLLKSDGFPLHIFRLAGIYGPGRSALDSLRAGVAHRIHKPGHVFGRIHVEDIVQVLLASMESPDPGNIYNLCDDEPAPSADVIEYACQLLGRPLPPLVEFDNADLAPMTRSFYMENRRVRNDKIKDKLGVSLKYPNYRAGLDGCLEAEEYALSQLREKEGSSGIFGFS